MSVNWINQLVHNRDRTWVMGILNLTPDSFSDGGRYNSMEKALFQAERLVKEGADILDIGGESTRPGADYVSEEEELQRVVPVIAKIASEIDIPISIDTYKANVARAAVESGAHIINDIWGAKYDPEMASTMAELGVPVILVHNRENGDYQSFLQEVPADLLESVNRVRQAGVSDEMILLDPGIGFAKTYEENLLLMRNLEQIVELGYPVLLGTSRKSMIGQALQLPSHERIEGTSATVALGIMKGCRIIRVHDVKEMSRVARMMDAMLYGV